MMATTFIIIILTIMVGVLLVMLADQTRTYSRNQLQSQLSYLDAMKRQSDDIARLTEVIVQSAGKQLALRPHAAPAVKVPSWADTKPPEAFIKERGPNAR